MPGDFLKLLLELFSAGARLGCVMRDWDLSTIIPIYKNKGLVVEPANHRPLRLILIVRKGFEMGTLARPVDEKPEGLEKFGL